MAQVGTLEVPPELIEAFRNLLSPTNNRVTGAIRKHGYLPSKAQVAKLTNRSLLPQVRELWNTLTPEGQAAWKAAGAVTNMNGWNLFVQDLSYRLKYGISGIAIPSLLHQYKVGHIEIAAPAEKVVLAQYHPVKYYISKKMRGNTTLREDVAITEKLVLPLEIGLSYRSSLVAIREDYSARFYAIISSSYQGRTIESEIGFALDLATGWKRTTTSITEVVGAVRSYSIWIELDGLRGSFEWDNVLSRHTGTNYARDFRCNDVNNELTRANFMIEASWEEQFLPAGAGFGSIYPAD